MSYTKKSIPTELRLLVHHRDMGYCALCGAVGVLVKYGKQEYYCKRVFVGTYDCKRVWRQFHVDHIIQECLGGETILNNLRLLCPKCNLRRRKYEVVSTSNR